MQFDRCSTDRTDEYWVRESRALAEARFVLFFGDRFELALTPGDSKPAMLARGQLPPEADPDSASFLGRIGDELFFSIHLPDHRVESEAASLRSLAPLLEPAFLEMLGTARALHAWQTTHRYCGVCGSPTETRAHGQILVCANPHCAREVYPRVDPAIIVMVTHRERALLVNKPEWPERRRSVIAGFVDAGETLEDAVRREVFEESGIVVDTVDYVCSQSWPFPGSLMLACRAEAVTTAIDTSRDTELRLAQWYTREELLAEIEQEGAVLLPDTHAVSRLLIDQWLEEGVPV